MLILEPCDRDMVVVKRTFGPINQYTGNISQYDLRSARKFLKTTNQQNATKQKKTFKVGAMFSQDLQLSNTKIRFLHLHIVMLL